MGNIKTAKAEALRQSAANGHKMDGDWMRTGNKQTLSLDKIPFGIL